MRIQFRPKLDKIVEILLYLSSKKPGYDKYQAVKFFYLADREHINRYGRPVSGEKYFALPYGPVASNVMDILEGDRRILNEAGLDCLPFDIEVKEVSGRSLLCVSKPKREVDFSLFSKSDIKVIDEIIEKYGDCTFDELFNITHKHHAYVRAWSSRRPGSKRAEMFYEEMIEDPKRRAAFIEDFIDISENVE